MWAYICWVLSSWGIWLLRKAAWWLLMAGLKWLSRVLIERAYKMLKKQAAKRDEVRGMLLHGQLMCSTGITQKDAKLSMLRCSSYMFSSKQQLLLKERIEKEN